MEVNDLEKENKFNEQTLKKLDKKSEVIQNQQNEKYQDGVLEDKLDHNKAIYTFNNRDK